MDPAPCRNPFAPVLIRPIEHGADIVVHSATKFVEESLWAGILLGIASYWLPTILFLLLPVWIYLYYRRLLDLHAFLASLIGIGLVAIWAEALIVNPFAQEPAIANPWVDFFAPETLWVWIPVGSVLFAYIVSSIARNILKVR